MVSTKHLTERFYTLNSPNYFKCRYCNKIRKNAPGNGYSNLLSHLKDKHLQHVEDYNEYERSGCETLDAFGFISDIASNLYHWIRWVVERNMALVEVDNELTRSMSQWDPVSSQTLKKYMVLVERKVETAITEEMPSVIGIMLDGWSAGLIYYVAIYAIYVVNGISRRVLLALAPLLDETDFGADAHIEFITETLDVFGKRPDCVRFIVGDNCATNQAIATRMGLPLVGCASHRLNLAIQSFAEDHDDLLSRVNNVMIRLRTKKSAGALRKHTSLCPVKRNIARWSSTFKMVKRFLEIKDAVKQIEAAEELVPRAHEVRVLAILYDDLRALESVSQKLQSNETTFAGVRVLFDGVAKRYPIMADHLSQDSSIVHSPIFETAVVKATRGDSLTRAATAAIAPFRIGEATSEDGPVESTSFAAALLHAGSKRSRAATDSACYDSLLYHVPPTSNDCERLFSKAKAVLTPQRSSMFPVNFEMIMFLKENSSFWDRRTVALVQQGSSTETETSQGEIHQEGDHSS